MICASSDNSRHTAMHYSTTLAYGRLYKHLHFYTGYEEGLSDPASHHYLSAMQ